jgi:hypothetical protein
VRELYEIEAVWVGPKTIRETVYRNGADIGSCLFESDRYERDFFRRGLSKQEAMKIMSDYFGRGLVRYDIFRHLW